MIVISLGGSIIVQDEIQVEFLKKFKKLILRFLKKGERFVVVTGGGKTCRKYQQAAAAITDLNNEDRDWLGIEATRLNAALLKAIFSKQTKSEILISSGLKPGFSTDFVAVLMAKKFKTNRVINLSNVDYVYDKNPKEFTDAKPIKEICWENYRKLIGSRWVPGMSAPFDPIASKEAQIAKIRVFIIKGTDINNFEKLLSGKDFQGTIIA